MRFVFNSLLALFSNDIPCSLSTEFLGITIKGLKKKSCPGNPNCFFGLGEDDKKPLQDSIGLNPNTVLRQDNRFVGLEVLFKMVFPKLTLLNEQNLGATCYMNSCLQMLFINRNFRNAVYEWKRSTNATTQTNHLKNCSDKTQEEEPQLEILNELALLFSRLQDGNTSSIAPYSFSRSLGIKVNVQQDLEE